MTSRKRFEKVLGRFKKKELFQVAVKLGFKLSDKQIERSTKKYVMLMLMEECLNKRLSSQDLLELELHWLSSSKHCVRWKSYKLDYEDSHLITPCTTTDPKVFSTRLHRFLGNIYHYEMAQDLKPSGLWVCLHLSEEGRVPYTCCLVRCTATPYLFVSGLQQRHAEVILEGVCLALGGVGLIDQGLSGRSLESLIDLTLNQHSQGVWSAYRLNQVDPNPLSMHHHYKHSLPPSDNITDEDRSNWKSRSEAEDIFGVNPLPQLEQFTFKLKVPQVVNEAEEEDSCDDFTCRVKFSGTNVLEGIKEAVASSCFSSPLPDLVKRMPSYGSNSVTLKILPHHTHLNS